VFEAEVLGLIPADRKVSVERETFPLLVDRGALYAMGTDDYWLDAGTPAAYLQAHYDLLQGARGGLPAPGAQNQGRDVWTLGDARVLGDTGPRVLLGDGSLVEQGATVIGSVIGAGSTIRSGARIVDSVLLADVEVASNAVIESSIVGSGASIGEGASLSELAVIGHGETVANSKSIVGEGSSVAGAI
jgi:mannose-1-phosphate guanylyltransferase